MGKISQTSLSVKLGDRKIYTKLCASMSRSSWAPQDLRDNLL